MVLRCPGQVAIRRPTTPEIRKGLVNLTSLVHMLEFIWFRRVLTVRHIKFHHSGELTVWVRSSLGTAGSLRKHQMLV